MNENRKGRFLLNGWTGLTSFLSPFLSFYLYNRCKKGKEIKERLKERKGYASLPSFQQSPIQFHAASVGELISILPLIDKIHQLKPDQPFLITTGTMTSFHIFQHYIKENKTLAPFVHHQFIPLDVPQWIDRFLTYWHPSLIVLVESELWPNLIQQAYQKHIPLALINARLSDRSLKRWTYFPNPLRILLSRFDWITTQSPQDQHNFLQLGVSTSYHGNLKQTAPKLSCKNDELKRLQEYFLGKPIWLAASTHPTEEAFIKRVHEKLRQKHPELITIIVPRHPERSQAIIHEIGTVARRSLKEMPFENGIWLCDTLGELGLFYRLAPIVFMGNSLASTPKGGGHNPFEPAILDCVISTGPKTYNFNQAYTLLQDYITFIHTQDDLCSWVDTMLTSPEKRKDMVRQSQAVLNQNNGLTDHMIRHLLELQGKKS